MSERVNHAEEVLKLIDRVLLEEEFVLEIFKKMLDRDEISQDQFDQEVHLAKESA